MHDSQSAPCPISCIFTDIIDSTNLWEFDATAMWEALQIHDALIRTQISIFGGYEVKTGGDSFRKSRIPMLPFKTISANSNLDIVFSDARAALRCCLSVQRKMHNTIWQPKIVAYYQRDQLEETEQVIRYRGLTIRMGLHFGTPHAAVKNPVSQRMDFYGPMVNTSSRVQSRANGGQIAVSDQFIREVWRLQTSGREDVMSLPLDTEKRTEILLKEASTFSEFFALDPKKGWFKLKGVKEKVHVTLINCTPPEKSVRILEEVS
jgi:adenylate cyclase